MDCKDLKIGQWYDTYINATTNYSFCFLRWVDIGLRIKAHYLTSKSPINIYRDFEIGNTEFWESSKCREMSYEEIEPYLPSDMKRKLDLCELY